MPRRSLFVVIAIGSSILACDRTSMTGVRDGGPQESGSDAAMEVGAAAMQEARALADALELGFQRWNACGSTPRDTGIWENSDRACFVGVIARSVERGDDLSACLRAAALDYAQCGEATSCSSDVCHDAILLDDNPLEELASDTCGISGEARDELRACR